MLLKISWSCQPNFPKTFENNKMVSPYLHPSYLSLASKLSILWWSPLQKIDKSRTLLCAFLILLIMHLHSGKRVTIEKKVFLRASIGCTLKIDHHKPPGKLTIFLEVFADFSELHKCVVLFTLQKRPNHATLLFMEVAWKGFFMQNKQITTFVKFPENWPFLRGFCHFCLVALMCCFVYFAKNSWSRNLC